MHTRCPCWLRVSDLSGFPVTKSLNNPLPPPAACPGQREPGRRLGPHPRLPQAEGAAGRSTRGQRGGGPGAEGVGTGGPGRYSPLYLSFEVHSLGSVLVGKRLEGWELVHPRPGPDLSPGLGWPSLHVSQPPAASKQVTGPPWPPRLTPLNAPRPTGFCGAGGEHRGGAWRGLGAGKSSPGLCWSGSWSRAGRAHGPAARLPLHAWYPQPSGCEMSALANWLSVCILVTGWRKAGPHKSRGSWAPGGKKWRQRPWNPDP